MITLNDLNKLMNLQRQNLLKFVETLRYIQCCKAELQRELFREAIAALQLDTAKTILHYAEQNNMLHIVLRPTPGQNKQLEEELKRRRALNDILMLVIQPILTAAYLATSDLELTTHVQADFADIVSAQPENAWAQSWTTNLLLSLSGLAQTAYNKAYDATVTSYSALVSAGLWGIEASKSRFAKGMSYAQGQWQASPFPAMLGQTV